MFLVVFLFGVFGGAMTTQQLHYDACKKQNFYTYACSCEKHLHSLRNK